MKTMFLGVFLLIYSTHQQQTTRAELCDLLQKKLEAKCQNIKPYKIKCDKYGNIEFHVANPDSPNQKCTFNLFEINNKTEQIEWVNGEKPYELTIFCRTKCISLLDWWKVDQNIYTDTWEWQFLYKEDANYIVKSLINLKSKCIRDPNR